LIFLLQKIDMFHPKSLQQRTIIFILVPVFLFLTLAGLIGFRAVRKVMLNQWGETAVANLEREAHSIDMRLNRPKQILSLLEGLNKKNSTVDIHQFIIDQLNKIYGVVSVEVDWPNDKVHAGTWFMRNKMTGNRMNGNRMNGNENWYGAQEIVAITTPAYNVEHNSKTFSLVSKFVDDKGDTTGTIEVIIDFESLISQTVKTRWWNIYKAYLIDLNGNVLTSTINEKNKISDQDEKIFGITGILEQKTFAAMKDNKSGTVFGPGHPPMEISGFYRLKEAPWTLVVVAPGKKVLQPIINFRLVYFLTAAACIGIILLFIRLMITQTTEAIKKVSQTAGNLAQGIFAEPLSVTSRDEVGELTRNFNTMSSQLQKGLRLQEAMNIAKEVQLTLLPQTDYSAEGLEVSGLSVYCDETGGDYFDFIESDSHPGRLHVVVGDVVGHGIGAALLMASLRAFVRAEIDQQGSPHELIADVNQQLCRDTSQSGNFASLFYLTIDAAQQELQWVRAGHDPGILFAPARGEFMDLKGKGLVLGLDGDYQYQTNTFALTGEKTVILISSDGAWEAENETREQFGRQRLKDIVAENYHLPPSALLECITAAIDEFRGSMALHDDITLVAVTIDGTVYSHSQTRHKAS
jgi:sigma-B regulation protein RsbU (phosphoserine phosphatase)